MSTRTPSLNSAMTYWLFRCLNCYGLFNIEFTFAFFRFLFDFFSCIIVCPSEKLNLSIFVIFSLSKKCFTAGFSSNKDNGTYSNSCISDWARSWFTSLHLASIGRRQVKTVNSGSLLVMNTSPFSFAAMSLLFANPIPVVRSLTFSKHYLALSSRNGSNSRCYLEGQIPYPVSTMCVSTMAPC